MSSSQEGGGGSTELDDEVDAMLNQQIASAENGAGSAESGGGDGGADDGDVDKNKPLSVSWQELIVMSQMPLSKDACCIATLLGQLRQCDLVGMDSNITPWPQRAMNANSVGIAPCEQRRS